MKLKNRIFLILNMNILTTNVKINLDFKCDYVKNNIENFKL